MRGFLFGLATLTVVALTVLSLRPGGVRAQLRFAARRLRLALVLAGLYLAVAICIRLVAPHGPLADWGPAVSAAILAAAFVLFGQDPEPEASSPRL